MRRPLVTLVWSLVLLIAALPVQAAEQGALFRLSLGGHTMHLFGTLHVGTPGFYPLEPQLMAALAQSSTLALEVDPDVPRAELLRVLRAHGAPAPADPGYDTLNPAARRRLDRLVQTSGFDAAAVLRYQPVLLASLLALAEYTKQGYRADLSSDAWLARQARGAGVRVLGLDTLDGQLALLDRLAPPDRWRYLDETMGTIESGAQRASAHDLAQAWAAADQRALDDIAARCAKDVSVSGRFANEVLIRGRNAVLAEKILALLLVEERAMTAIGVLHLLGEGSVPTLLSERGVVVERIY